jgi:hypothetical protein
VRFTFDIVIKYRAVRGGHFFKYRDVHVTLVKTIVRFIFRIVVKCRVFRVGHPCNYCALQVRHLDSRCNSQSVGHVSEGTFTNPCQNELLLRS